MPKVVKVVFEQALQGCRDSQKLLFRQFLVTQGEQARERLARSTKVTANLPGGGKAEKLTDAGSGGGLGEGLTITFSVVGAEDDDDDDRVIDVSGERIDED